MGALPKVPSNTHKTLNNCQTHTPATADSVIKTTLVAIGILSFIAMITTGAVIGILGLSGVIPSLAGYIAVSISVMAIIGLSILVRAKKCICQSQNRRSRPVRNPPYFILTTTPITFILSTPNRAQESKCTSFQAAYQLMEKTEQHPPSHCIIIVNQPANYDADVLILGIKNVNNTTNSENFFWSQYAKQNGKWTHSFLEKETTGNQYKASTNTHPIESQCDNNWHTCLTRDIAKITFG